MYCPSCGQQIADGSKFCTLCGSKLIPSPQKSESPAPAQSAAPVGYESQNYSYAQNQSQQAYSYGSDQPQPGRYVSENAQPAYGAGQTQPRAGGDPKYGGLPMKWHKFLVYFGLWAGAVINCISGISTMAGGQYGDSRDRVYAVFTGLSAIDILYGAFLIAMAVLGVITALRLLKLKAGAPKLLYILYGVGVVTSIVYMLLASAVTHLPIGDFFSSSTVSSLVTGIAFFAINVRYYQKRESLFVN